MKKSERSIVLDEIKAIACIFVVLIHCKFPGVLGDLCEALARFGVPMFFAVAGKYLLTSDQCSVSSIRTTMWEKIKRLIITTLSLLVFYTLYSLLYSLAVGYGFREWLAEKYNTFELSRLILFNSGKFIYDFTYSFDHIWFLLALLYVYILVAIFASKVRKWAGGLTVILLIGLFIGELLQTYYPIRPFGISVSTWYVVRNWLFVGVPFTMLGFWFNEKGKHFILLQSAMVDITIIFSGIIITVIEYFVFGSKEVYLGSLLIVIGCLYISESIYVTGNNKLEFIGRYLSANVYYMHVFVISFFGFIIDHTNADLYGNVLFMYVRPVIVVMLTIIISLLMYYLGCNKMERKAA